MKNQNLAKKANGLFFIVVLLSLLANIFVSWLKIKGISIHIVANLLVSQMIIIVPGLVFYVFITRENIPFRMYKPIKPLSVLLLLVFTWLLMPLVTAANAFSQLFTKNELMDISGSILSLPFIPMVLIMGIVGPFCEEFVFRGLINNCFVYQTGRYVASGLVSGLFFGLMHMNFNQFCYAFILGLVFALIDEVLESTWPSFICHAIVNTQNVCMLYITDSIMQKMYGLNISETYSKSFTDAANGFGKMAILVMFVGLLVVSIVTTLLACLLFYGISAIEGKEDRVKALFAKNTKEKKEKLVFWMGSTAILFCIFVMFLLDPILNFIKK